jgi:hypothetical protein
VPRPPRAGGACALTARLCAKASALGGLASLLVSTSPLYARGVAMLEQLLTDGTGAVYRGDTELLAHTLEQCRAAITGFD